MAATVLRPGKPHHIREMQRVKAKAFHHIERLKRAPKLTRAEELAAIARWLTKHKPTRCPPALSWR